MFLLGLQHSGEISNYFLSLINQISTLTAISLSLKPLKILLSTFEMFLLFVFLQVFFLINLSLSVVGYFDHIVTLQTGNKVYLESGGGTRG